MCSFFLESQILVWDIFPISEKLLDYASSVVFIDLFTPATPVLLKQNLWSVLLMFQFFSNCCIFQSFRFVSVVFLIKLFLLIRHLFLTYMFSYPFASNSLMDPVMIIPFVFTLFLQVSSFFSFFVLPSPLELCVFEFVFLL